MSTDSSVPMHTSSASLPAEEERFIRPARFPRVSESTAVRGVIDVTMVGLIGGGPRLAIRAARVLLEDSYAARASERHGSKA
jgi:hypothetical protein